MPRYNVEIGYELEVRVTGERGRVAMTNGHAAKVCGKWHFIMELKTPGIMDDGFVIGERVQRSSTAGCWCWGYVTCLDPLLVTERDCLDDEGIEWNEVRKGFHHGDHIEALDDIEAESPAGLVVKKGTFGVMDDAENALCAGEGLWILFDSIEGDPDLDGCVWVQNADIPKLRHRKGFPINHSHPHKPEHAQARLKELEAARAEERLQCQQPDILDPLFSFTIEGGWINSGKAIWCGPWINAFECLGEAEAACLSPPKLQEWQVPTYDCYSQQGTKDPALEALREGGSLEEIKKLFVEPNDLLKWYIDGVDSDHESVVMIALGSQISQGHNVDILDHLLMLSPSYFMQQMTMTQGGHTNQSPLGNLLQTSDNPGKVANTLAVVQWLCGNGVMTDTIFTYCKGTSRWGGAGQPDLKDVKDDTEAKCARPKVWKSALDHARACSEGVDGMADVVAELERWNNMSVVEKRMLTEERFADLLASALPRK